METRRTGVTANSGVRVHYLRVKPIDIALVKFLFESYEEVGIVRTIDRHAAVIVVLVADDFASVAECILQDLRRTIDCVELPAPPGRVDDWLMDEFFDSGA